MRLRMGGAGRPPGDRDCSVRLLLPSSARALPLPGIERCLAPLRTLLLGRLLGGTGALLQAVSVGTGNSGGVTFAVLPYLGVCREIAALLSCGNNAEERALGGDSPVWSSWSPLPVLPGHRGGLDGRHGWLQGGGGAAASQQVTCLVNSHAARTHPAVSVVF